LKVRGGNVWRGFCIYFALWHLPIETKGNTMLLRKINSCLLAAAIAAPVLITGCAVHAHAYYDPYYHDYHPIDGEVVYYNQWETETHRQHVDLQHRNKDEQKEYWDWRHKHEDHH
jgi:hypothetical protein